MKGEREQRITDMLCERVGWGSEGEIEREGKKGGREERGIREKDNERNAKNERVRRRGERKIEME